MGMHDKAHPHICILRQEAPKPVLEQLQVEGYILISGEQMETPASRLARFV